MTREEIMQMEAGREMDALVAINIFNWRWMQYPAPNEPRFLLWLTLLCPPPEICSVQSPNEYWKIWKPSNAQAERFIQWDGNYWRDLEGNEHKGFSHYSTDISAAWEVVEKMKTNRLEMLLDNYSPKWTCSFSPVNGGFGEDINADTASLAICQAALLAVLDA